MRGTKISALALAAACAGACTTMSTNGLYKEFRSFGFTQDESDCLVRELDGALTAREMSEILDEAQFVANGGERNAFFRLMRNKDENIKGAIAAAGRACLPRSHT